MKTYFNFEKNLDKEICPSATSTIIAIATNPT